MNQLSLLDCTLRDGGYVNNWHFGHEAICDILDKLVISNVDYIECGYLSQIKGGSPDETQFAALDAIERLLPEKHLNQNYAVMINFGEYDIDAIPVAKEESIIIRVCFHKKAVDAAIKYCGELKEKNYKVFVQPMASLNYTDSEFIELINKTNAMKADCFYIVDSFGVVEMRDFQRLIAIADHNLNMDIMLGYHSHNNLQQAYGNAKFFVEQNLKHNLILDASVYGMGRGAGNLNMELFASYLNRNYGKNYNIDAFLDIMDEYLKPIFSEHFWGYSLPFYLSAQYNCHPNYANYFADKNTLTNKSMKQLLAGLPDDVKNSYSAEKAEEYYQEFQKKFVDDHDALNELRKAFEDKELLVLAPGKSLAVKRGKVSEYIDQHRPVIIAVNVVPADYPCDYLICTNEKRLKKLELPVGFRLILTSNIAKQEKWSQALVINYSSYLSEQSLIADNPTLMLLQLFINIGIKKIAIAGFDGYSPDSKENYFDVRLSMGTSISLKLQKNSLIREKVKGLGKLLNIEFVTESLYQ